jgi:hypothetical protein
MKTIWLSLFSLAALALAASCASVDSRVQDHQAAFESWPADVQDKVRAGQVDVGFTQEMVTVALGKPDRITSRTSDRGVEEGWVYMDKGPKFSIGLGLGSSRGSSAFGGGVTVGDDWRDEEVLRVMFQGGKVSAIERRR